MHVKQAVSKYVHAGFICLEVDPSSILAKVGLYNILEKCFGRDIVYGGQRRTAPKRILRMLNCCSFRLVVYWYINHPATEVSWLYVLASVLSSPIFCWGFYRIVQASIDFSIGIYIWQLLVFLGGSHLDRSPLGALSKMSFAVCGNAKIVKTCLFDPVTVPMCVTLSL